MSRTKKSLIGQNLPIRDAALKTTGEMRYVGDMKLPRMLHGKILFSPHPHARIKSINLSEAAALPGVHAVVCYHDAPDVAYNSCGEDINIFKVERVFDSTMRFVGDRVAAVAAETPAIAEKALRLIQVEYEILPAIFDPEKALAEGAVAIHEGGNLLEEVAQEIGDVEAGFAKADLVVEDRYQTQAIHHGAIEPHVAIAQFDSLGRLTVYTPSQDTFGVRTNLTRIFGLPMSKVRVIAPVIGGAFGGKIDAILEPVAALLAIKTGRPVKIELNRREDLATTRTRHAITITLKTGVKKDGTIVAQEYQIVANAGAYATGSSSIVWAMCSKVFRLIHAKNIRFVGKPVYTNTQPAGAMRGFGSPQEFFAQQRQMNRIAKILGISMLQMEEKNLVSPNDMDLRTKSPLGSPRPLDCVAKGAELFDWAEGLAHQEKTKDLPLRIGVGMAAAVHGNGVYGVRPDTCGITLKMNEDGTVVLFTGNHDMGNGVVTLQTQMVSEVLGLPLASIAVVQADTETTMAHFGDFSSRGTFVCGQAAQKCAEILASQMKVYAAELLCTKREEIVLSSGLAKDSAGQVATFGQIVAHAMATHQTDIIVSHTYAAEACASSYGAHFAKVEVNTQTGAVRVLDYVAVHDVGRALNPLSLEGQIQGAVQMGLGHALCEDAGVDESGTMKNQSFRKYKLIQSIQMPEKIRIAFVENEEPFGPFGAKSIGECAVVPCIGALGNAIANAIGLELNQLPLTPEVILNAINQP